MKIYLQTLFDSKSPMGESGTKILTGYRAKLPAGTPTSGLHSIQ